MGLAGSNGLIKEELMQFGLTGSLCSSLDGCGHGLFKIKICWLEDKGEDVLGITWWLARVGYSPKENIRKVQEETVFSAEVGSLLAVLIPTAFSSEQTVCKFVFDCQLLDGQFSENQKLQNLVFDIKNLPPLSEKRITKEQMEILWVYPG